MVEVVKYTRIATPAPKVSICAGVNGWSKVTLKGGEVFEGWFVNGIPMGEGSLTLIGGTHYEGAVVYSNGVMTITGKVAFTNGKVNKGVWYKFIDL